MTANISLQHASTAPRRNQLAAIWGILVVIGFPCITTLEAGEITGATPFPGINSIALTAVVPPVVAGNDNFGAGVSPNEYWVTQKDYIAVGPVDIVFTVIDNIGTTEYKFREGVSNSTGLDWTGYHIELGFGTGAGFVKSESDDELDFDSPDFDSDVDFNPGGFFFPDVDVTEDDIIASGGIHEYLDFAGYFIFHVDVPNGITEFTIRQSPIAEVSHGSTPEPSTFALAALGLLSLALISSRRRRK